MAEREIQRVPSRCWGVYRYDHQCSEASTHVLRGGDVNTVPAWSCRQHLAQVADRVRGDDATVIIAAVAWQKSV